MRNKEPESMEDLESDLYILENLEETVKNTPFHCKYCHHAILEEISMQIEIKRSALIKVLGEEVLNRRRSK